LSGPQVLILGGTGEARALAGLLHARGVAVLTSLAGRVRDPLLPAGQVRVGGFGGREGFAAWLARHPAAVVVDATHPFAATMTATAAAVTAAAGVPCLRLQRPPWRPGPGDRWIEVPSLEQAAEQVRARAGRTLLTVGRQGLAAFHGCAGVPILARVIDPPDGPLPPNIEVLPARGPFTEDEEVALLAGRGIAVLVTKNSGGAMTEAKLRAARTLAVPVVMVARPELPAGVPVADTPAAAARWALRALRT
jgi:precorrin-6A/cobalt-precorrin-6A reductase